ncbi:hypothetical protein [Myroides odoratimimus]|uniref:hypothetical protein n=1 Tax=Myroides odoratimimus TaxID=76832 RepID=UPI000468A856|nr:hypothetical protein [Myroides odoratimimus]
MKKDTVVQSLNMDNTPKITYTNKQIKVDLTKGQVAKDISFVKELIALGTFERLDKLIEETRAEKKLKNSYSICYYNTAEHERKAHKYSNERRTYLT